MNNWTLTTLEECTTQIGDGIHGTPIYDNKGDYSFINGNNLNRGQIVIKDNTKRVDRSQFEKHGKRLDERTILLSINGTLGNTAYYRGERVILGKSACYLQVRDDIDLDYVYYVISSARFKYYLNRFATGTTIKNVSLKQVRDYEFPIPSVYYQKKVSCFLKTIDRLIIANERANDYLAESIRALFSHWFVDFAPFTGEPYVESEIGRIPSSIRLVPLKDLTKTITKGTTPTTLGYRFTEHGINYIKGESILDDHSFDYSKFAHIDDETNIALKRSIIENRDLLFTIAGTLGRFAMAVPEILPANTNQAVGIIRPDVEKIAPEVLLSYFISGWQNDYYSRRVQQAVQANLSLATLKSLPVPVLIGERRIEYEDLIVPIVHAIESNNAQNRKLIDLRDTLLPKLMSGEIDMSEIAVY